MRWALYGWWQISVFNNAMDVEFSWPDAGDVKPLRVPFYTHWHIICNILINWYIIYNILWIYYRFFFYLDKPVYTSRVRLKLFMFDTIFRLNMWWSFNLNKEDSRNIYFWWPLKILSPCLWPISAFVFEEVSSTILLRIEFSNILAYYFVFEN